MEKQGMRHDVRAQTEVDKDSTVSLVASFSIRAKL